MTCCYFCILFIPLTFVVMVLHCDDATSGDPGVINDGFMIQGFDGEWVDHTDVDSF